MSRFFVLVILIGLIVYFIGPYFPFWGLMILVGLVTFFVRASPEVSFFACGLSFGLVWLTLTVWITIDSGSNLPNKMAELMGLTNENLLWIGTGIIGFIIGGFSGFTGSLFSRIFEKRDKGVYKSQL